MKNYLKIVSLVFVALLAVALPVTTQAADPKCAVPTDVNIVFNGVSGYDVDWKSSDAKDELEPVAFNVDMTCFCGFERDGLSVKKMGQAFEFKKGQPYYTTKLTNPCEDYQSKMNPYKRNKNCGECWVEVKSICLTDPVDPKCGKIDSCEIGAVGACEVGKLVKNSYRVTDEPVNGCPTACTWKCEEDSKVIDCNQADTISCGVDNNTYVQENWYLGKNPECLKNGKPAPKCFHSPYLADKADQYYYQQWKCGESDPYKKPTICRTCFQPVCNANPNLTDEEYTKGDWNQFCKYGTETKHFAIVRRKGSLNDVILSMKSKDAVPEGLMPGDTIIKWTYVCRAFPDCQTQNAELPETTCTVKREWCGDGIVQGDARKHEGEECDEGVNNGSGGLCDSECKWTYCGDNVVQNKPTNGKGKFGDTWVENYAKQNRFEEQCDLGHLVVNGEDRSNLINGPSSDCTNSTRYKCNEPRDGRGGDLEATGICNECRCEPGEVKNIRCMKACAAPGQVVAESDADCGPTEYFDADTCSCKVCEDCDGPVDETCNGTAIMTGYKSCVKATRKCVVIRTLREDCQFYPLGFGYSLIDFSTNPKWGRDALTGYLKCIDPKTWIGTGKCVRNLQSHVPGAKMKCELKEDKKCAPGACGAKCAEGETDPDKYMFDIDGNYKKAKTKDQKFCYESKPGLCDDATCAFGPPVQTQFCGDGVEDFPCEACDDGNRVSGDGCSNNCTLECGEGHMKRMSEAKWQEAVEASKKSTNTWLCADGTSPKTVTCKDIYGNDLKDCKPVNAIAERHWECPGDVKCMSYNEGCAYPNDGFFSGPLTMDSAAMNNFEKVFVGEKGCLKKVGLNQYEAWTIGDLGEEWMKHLELECANLFCYNKEVPYDIKYNPWSTTNMNPSWTWSCPSDNGLQGANTCKALEMACAPRTFMYDNDRQLDSFTSDAKTSEIVPVPGQALPDDRKMTRTDFTTLFNERNPDYPQNNLSNKLCFNGGRFVFANENKPNHLNFNDAYYSNAFEHGFHDNDLFKYNDYKLINDNQGRWMWTCEYGTDETGKTSFPNYNTFKGDVLNENYKMKSDMYCSFDELAQCRYEYSETSPKFSKNEIVRMAGVSTKGWNTLCASSYIDVNNKLQFPGSTNGLKFVTDKVTGENSVFYFCASDYKTNSSWLPVEQADGSWAIESKGARSEAYEDPLCRVNIKGCQTPPNGRTDYTVRGFYADMNVCFKNGQYSESPECNNLLCEDGLNVSDFTSTLVNNQWGWTWSCEGDQCQVGSTCEREQDISQIYIEELPDNICTDDNVNFKAKIFVGTCNEADIDWTFEVYDKGGNLVTPGIGIQDRDVYAVKMKKEYAGYQVKVKAICNNDCSRQINGEATATMEVPEMKNPQATIIAPTLNKMCLGQMMTLNAGMTGCDKYTVVGFEKRRLNPNKFPLYEPDWTTVKDEDAAPGWQVKEESLAGNWEYQSLVRCDDCNDDVAKASSNSVWVNIEAPEAVEVTITQTPEIDTFCADTPSTLTAVGAKCNGIESYEWIDLADNKVMGTDAVLQLPKGLKPGDHNYEVIFTCSDDICADPNTAKANIKVVVKDFAKEPTITKEPKSQLDKCLNNVDDLSGAGTCSDGDISYQWEKFDANTKNWKMEAGQITDTYSAPSAGIYRLRMTCANECGSRSDVTGEAEVTIKDAPAIPENTSISKDSKCNAMTGPVTVQAKAKCVDSEPVYRWSWSATETGNYTAYTKVNSNDSEGNSSLIADEVKAGYYKVSITCLDDCGVESAPAVELGSTWVQRVEKPEAPTVTLKPNSDLLCKSKTEKLEVIAEAICKDGAYAIYSWSRSNDRDGVYAPYDNLWSIEQLNPNVGSGFYKVAAKCENTCNMVSDEVAEAGPIEIERIEEIAIPDNVKLEGDYKCKDLDEVVDISASATCATGEKAVYEWLRSDTTTGTYSPYDLGNDTNVLNSLAIAGFYKVNVFCQNIKCAKNSAKVPAGPVELHRIGLSSNTVNSIKASRNKVCARNVNSVVTLTPKYDGSCEGGTISYEWSFAMGPNGESGYANISKSGTIFEKDFDAKTGVLKVYNIDENYLHFKYRMKCSYDFDACVRTTEFSDSVKITATECICGNADPEGTNPNKADFSTKAKRFTNAYFEDQKFFDDEWLCKGSVATDPKLVNGDWSWSCLDEGKEIAKCGAKEIACGEADGGMYAAPSWNGLGFDQLCVNTRSGKAHKNFTNAPVDMLNINDLSAYGYKAFNNVDKLLDEKPNTSEVDMKAVRYWLCYGDGGEEDMVQCKSDVASCGPADARQLIAKAGGVNVIVPKTSITGDGTRYHASYNDVDDVKANMQHMCILGNKAITASDFGTVSAVNGEINWNCQYKDADGNTTKYFCSARQDCGWAPKEGVNLSKCGDGANNDVDNKYCYPTVNYPYGNDNNTCWTAKNVKETVSGTEKESMNAWEAYDLSYDYWSKNGGYIQTPLTSGIVTSGSCPVGFVVPTKVAWHELEDYLDANDTACTLDRSLVNSWACSPAGGGDSIKGLKYQIGFNGKSGENYWTRTSSCADGFRQNMYRLSGDGSFTCYGASVNRGVNYCKATPIYYGLDGGTKVNQGVDAYSYAGNDRCYDATDAKVKNELRCVSVGAFGTIVPPVKNIITPKPPCVGIGCFRFR